MTERTLHLARKIAPALPGVWSAEPVREDLAHLATLARCDGLRLTLRETGGRAHASPQERPIFGSDMPDLHGFGILRHDEKRPRCSFDPNRSPQAIAGQIMRAVVAPFEPLLARYQERLSTERDQRQDLQQVTRAICETLGTSPIDVGRNLGPNQIELGLGPRCEAYGKITLSTYRSGNADIQLHNLSFEDAQELARWIAGRNRPLGSRG